MAAKDIYSPGVEVSLDSVFEIMGDLCEDGFVENELQNINLYKEYFEKDSELFQGCKALYGSLYLWIEEVPDHA
jgi:hypothetical protein